MNTTVSPSLMKRSTLEPMSLSVLGDVEAGTCTRGRNTPPRTKNLSQVAISSLVDDVSISHTLHKTKITRRKQALHRLSEMQHRESQHVDIVNEAIWCSAAREHRKTETRRERGEREKIDKNGCESKRRDLPQKLLLLHARGCSRATHTLLTGCLREAYVRLTCC